MTFRAPGPARPAGQAGRLPRRWPRRLIPAVAGLLALAVVIVAAAGVGTDYLWFRSVHHAAVFDVIYGARWAMFAAGGLAMAAATGLNMVLAFRFRPPSQPDPSRPGGAYRTAIDAHRRLGLTVAMTVVGLAAGVSAAGGWRTWLLFANRVPFHQRDPQFHLDLSFFVFDYPFIRLILSYLFAAVLLSLAAAAAVHLLYGGLRWRERRPRATRAAQAHLYLLMGVFVLLKAAAYWVDRFGIDFSQHAVVATGASYTDVNAVLPAKTVLAVIAALCAGLFFAGSLRRRPTAPAVGFGLLALSAVLVGGVYPLVVEQFVVKPNELANESPYINREIAATRAAYGVSHVRVIAYPGTPSVPQARLVAQVAALPGAPLMDPDVMAQAFRQLEQVKSYYDFPQALSVDRYLLPGAGKTPQDVLVAVRGVGDPPPGRASWVNTHLVYTHGFGLVAAMANAAQPAPSGRPEFVEAGLPPAGPLSRVVGRYQPRVYFGPQEDGYVIAGGAPGQPGRELDYPSGGGQSDFTYTGGGGVPIGSLIRRLAYAVKFGQLDIALSGAVNQHSRILYDRQPLARVAKVAPFLTLDANPYPVIADHRLLWVVDGYTTTDNYPYSKRISLRQATATSQDPAGSVAGRRPGQINYLRNSVKAVVDAYTGAVTLYQWSPDPLLRAWMRAFPGLIKPRRDVPGYLLAHLRYPQAQFDVQRQILGAYHVTGARAFYGGQDFWAAPPDPSAPASRTAPAAPGYLTLSMPGYRQPRFTLASAYVPRGRSNLAAFMAVDSDPTQPGYGTIRILQLPQQAAVAGPAQVSADFRSYPPAAAQFAQWRRGGAAVTMGSLTALPVGGGLLYVQPVYVSASAAGAAGSYPTLQGVFVYCPGQPRPLGYGPTLRDALAQVFALPPAPASPGAGGGADPQVRRELALAERYYAQAQAALAAGDWPGYGQALARMKQALDQAQQAAGAGSAAAPPSPSRRHPRSAARSGR